MSDQSVPTVDFDDNEYVWPVGDVPGVPAAQLMPPTPPQNAIVTDVDFSKMWAAYVRLHNLVGGSADATLLDRVADRLEQLVDEVADLEEILAVAMNPTL